MTCEYRGLNLPEIKDRMLISCRARIVSEEQDSVNLEATKRISLLQNKLQRMGYEGHDLKVYLIRLLFCLFAEDIGIFKRHFFQHFIKQITSKDRVNLAQWLDRLFEVLNTSYNRRLSQLYAQLKEFPHINRNLHSERLFLDVFDKEMRNILLYCCDLNWRQISPVIFGALLQSVTEPDKCRNLGAYYTTEKNILKLIKSLFLDDLRTEFEYVKNSKKKLKQFHAKIAKLRFLDPACGCGNFLIIAYRELRLLELDILRCLLNNDEEFKLTRDAATFSIKCNLNQFYGVEIEAFSAQIAQIALCFLDCQIDLLFSEEFENNFVSLPLKKTATILCANSLKIDWADLVVPKDLNYIFGNPPFVGAKHMERTQRQDIANIFSGLKGLGLLDYASAWYRKSAEYMAYNTAIKTAFVSTNSIVQGEQVGVLWSDLLSRGAKIHFAHRTFQWSSGAYRKAAVHCIIIGFALYDIKDKKLFDYETVESEPDEIDVQNINPYLVDADNVVLNRRSRPLCSVPEIGIGNKPIDNGNYLFKLREREEFIQKEPLSAPYFRRWLGSNEFIHGRERFCLWLGHCSPNELRKMPECLKRVEAVRRYRLSSVSALTQRMADTPTRFHVENMPQSTYLLIPEVSSERRPYIPMGFIEPDTLSSNLVKISSEAKLYHFGVLSSAMHMAWVRTVCGRLKSDYRYSIKIVYNNFPWPQNPSKRQKKMIEDTAGLVLETRAKYSQSSLADLYDPLAMPADLVKAHNQLDGAVDAAYSSKKFLCDRDRAVFLFALYQQLNLQC